MKLTEKVLEEGRIFIRARDMDGFKMWCETHAPNMTWEEIERSLRPLFKADKVDMALRLFDKVFPYIDPMRDFRRGLVKLGFWTFLTLGALGGVVYLIKAIFF